MSGQSTPTPPADTRRPSKTNPQCKVCTSADRFEVEVALARGQSQESVATRFSRNGQSFSRQNIHTHYHKHMQVLELAVAEEAARRGLNPMLDMKRAGEIHAQHERNRARLRAQVDERINEGLEWKVRDVLAFMEQDVRLEEQRNQQRVEIVFMQARVFGEAVRKVVPEDLQEQILTAYDELIAKYEEIIGRKSDAQLSDFIYRDELLDKDASQA
jgi:hypothetical protein